MSPAFSVTVKLSLLIAGILTLAFGLIFLQFEKNQAADLHNLMLKQATNLFQQILVTREWNSHHGGVYVLKTPGTETNPYLEKMAPAVHPEIQDREGRIFTLLNPAMMTREISILTEEAGLVRYRMTSLDPLNPNNSPKPMEAEALRGFAAGNPYVAEAVRSGERQDFLFIAPLFTDEDCLTCHRNSRAGEVRGAISLLLPMAAELEVVAARRQNILFGGFFLLLLALVSLVLGCRILIVQPIGEIREFAARAMGRGGTLPAPMLRRRDEVGHLARYLQSASDEIGNYRQGLEELVEDRTHALQAAKEQLELLSRTDPLTGLGNRRHLELEIPRIFALSKRRQVPVSVVLVDIDRFKRFNDLYGHKIGDQVLVHLAQILKESIRPYDMAVRFGGEEFLLLLPCREEDGRKMAERIRCQVADRPYMLKDESLHTSISAGVSTAERADELESALRRADEALYQAKKQGRNRTVVYAEGWIGRPGKGLTIPG